MSQRSQISLNISDFSSGSLLSLRSQAHAVTQSGFAGGEFLPLPRSKGAAFPCLLILEGAPPLPQRRSETAGSHKNGGTPLKIEEIFRFFGMGSPCILFVREGVAHGFRKSCYGQEPLETQVLFL